MDIHTSDSPTTQSTWNEGVLNNGYRDINSPFLYLLPVWTGLNERHGDGVLLIDESLRLFCIWIL